MKNVLQLKTSLFSDAGTSSRLADEFVEAWRKAHPEATVTVRDLAREPVPHLDAERFQAFIARPEERTERQRALAECSDLLIEELRRADVIVIGLPMYNFGIPSTLKAYFDYIARAGITFKYTEQGAVGLLSGKKAYIFATGGGHHAGTEHDGRTTQVRAFLGLLGIETEFIYAEGLDLGPESRANSLAAARSAIARLVAGVNPDQQAVAV